MSCGALAQASLRARLCPAASALVPRRRLSSDAPQAAAPGPPDLPPNLRLADATILAPPEESGAGAGDAARPAVLASGELPPAGQLPMPHLALAANVVSLSSGQKVGEVGLLPDVWALPLRKDVVQQVVTWHRAKLRKGTASTKTYNDKSGSGRKPYAQKGSGRARAGNIRAPHRRGGVKTHGPKPRDWSYPLNAKVRNLGLRIALSAKLREGKLLVVDSADLGSHRTQPMADALAALGANDPATVRGGGSGCYLITDGFKDNAFLATRALKNVTCAAQDSVNVFEALRRKVLVVEEAALRAMQERLMGKYEGNSRYAGVNMDLIDRGAFRKGA